jgi:hypothetical protein
MKSYLKAAALAIFGIMLSLGCEKPDNTPEVPEVPRTNFFTYTEYTFDINSAVQYDKGDNSVEIWLSPATGLTTSREIKSYGDYVVLNTHRSYLGGRDRFNSQNSKDSYISFCDYRFTYGNEGTAYIDVTMTNDSLKVSFLADVLQTKHSPAPVAMLSGSYAGTYTVEKEKQYVNEWGIDREHIAVTDAVLTTREDGGNSSIALLEADGSEGIKIELPDDQIGREHLFTTSETPAGITLKYNNGAYLDLKGAIGYIKTSLDGSSAEVSVSIVKDGMHIRAEYTGAYGTDIVKENRFVYTYEGDSGYEGKQYIVKLMVSDNGGVLKMYFSPAEGYSITDHINKTHMPILTVPSSIVNDGRKAFTDLKNWKFGYDMMDVWPYQDEYRPHPAATDWIEINRKDNVYEVEFILSSIGEGSYTSTMDLYYKGEAR